MYLLRAEYNSIKSLVGLEDSNKLTYLYASNNLLGTDCDEEEGEGKKNCLSSLANKNKANAKNTEEFDDGLYYVNLRDNTNLKYVDYFKMDEDIRHLYLKGCSPNMYVYNISEILGNCGNNYDLPCKYLSGTTYTWSDYFYVGTLVEGKDELTADKLKVDLMGQPTITCLNLENCKTGKDDGNEITDNVRYTS